MYDATDWEFVEDVADQIMWAVLRHMPQSVIDGHRSLLTEIMAEMIEL